MSALAGVIYSDILQTSNFIEPMLDIMRRSSLESKESYTYRNFQIGCSNGQIASNAKKNIFLILDASLNSESLVRDFNFKEENKHLTPAEILLQAYEVYEIDFIKKINGEFAFTLLDQEKNVLYLARDRIGKKPIFWHQGKQHFIFATELKALLATGLVPQTAAQDAIATYLFFGFIPQDMTPIKGVSKLLPAHYLRFSPNQGTSIIPYWSYSSFFENPLKIHKSTIYSKINESLAQAVEKRIPKKESIGCFVSGGLGSATIAYYVNSLVKDRPIMSFTAGFKSQNDADVKAALEVANILSLNSEVKEIEKSSFIDDLVKIAWFLDEPLADPNAVATWQLCSLASKYTSTVFSGMGCDELLAGHSRYSLAERDFGSVSRLMLLPKPILYGLLIPICKLFFKNAAFNILKIARTNPIQFEFIRGNAIFNEQQLKDAAPALGDCFDPDTFLHKFYNISKISSTVSSLLYFDVKTRLPDCFIMQYERLTRANNLNWETPFLDSQVVELAASLPEPESLEENKTASYLKPIIRDVFPSHFLKRPKKTRKNFLAPWIMEKDIFDSMKLLTHGTLVETGFISKHWLEKQLINEETAKNSFQKLYSILMLEIWFRLFINRPIYNYPPQTSVQELLLEG